MTRFLSRAVATTLFASSAALGIEPPALPPPPWLGWQVIGPAGSEASVSTGEVASALAPQEPLSAQGVGEALAMSSEPPSGVQAQVLDTGLATTLPPEFGELVAETARALQYNWLLCYLFVRDNIRFTPYKGLSRGPTRTLLDREGSDADQAFLLLSLLRASGYSATACYSGERDGGLTFYVPLAGAANGYDAASWLGLSTNGTPLEVGLRAAGILQPTGLDYAVVVGATPQNSYLLVEHFSVYLYGVGRYLDPSFKPCRVSSPSTSLGEDMGYSRSNLLASAEGASTNDWHVQGLSAEGLSNELRRLAANLVQAWRGSAPAAVARDVVGGEAILPQDLQTDNSVFHGFFYWDWPYDFLAMSSRNAFRASLGIVHGGITNTCWTDELGTRGLWLSYTNAPGSDYPRAELRLDGDTVASEPTGASSPDQQAAIVVYHPSLAQPSGAAYSVVRAATNVYAIPFGFGSTAPGMLDLSVSQLADLAGEGRPGDDPRLRSAVLHSLGQQWLHQCALVNALYARLAGHAHFSLFETGLAGHETASFFDFKTGCETTSEGGSAPLYGGKIFTSALEHGVLDQANGPDRPAVSAVRVVGLANAAGLPTYLASTSNWQMVGALLTNYTPELQAYLGANVALGQKYLLPQDGQVALGQWTGAGFLAYGPLGAGSLLSGGLNGGCATQPGYTSPGAVLMGRPKVFWEGMDVQAVRSVDPVDMLSGAAVVERLDLTLGGPAPLAWARRYDSRRRGLDGPAGRGWSHGYESRVAVHADPGAAMGLGGPGACAASAVACTAVRDILADGESARNLTLACLVADWWAAQLLGGGATVLADGKALAFARLPDGAYEPAPGVTAALSKTNGAFALSARLGPIWLFATNGLLSRVEDRSGNRVDLSYTEGATLSSVSNAFGRALSLTWSGGRVAAVSDGAGRSVSYHYDAAGCLTNAVDAAGFGWQATYAADAALLSQTDPEGCRTILNAYNGLGQVTNQTSASGRSWGFAYAAGWRSWESDPFGLRVFHGFTGEGRPAWRSDRADNLSLAYHDARGHVVTNIDPAGRSRVFAYDVHDRLVRAVEAANTPAARTTAFAYDATHRLVAVTNALGLVTRFAYDANDRLVLATFPDGTAASNTWNAAGLRTAETLLDAAGQTLRHTAFAYDDGGRPATRTTHGPGMPCPVETATDFDAAGSLVRFQDANGRETFFHYDARGLLTNTVDAAGHAFHHAYGPRGLPASVTDPLGRTTAFLWTPSGNPAAVLLPDGAVATNEYDAADRRDATMDPRGRRVALGLDAVGRVTNRTASAWSDFTWYDAVGCATSVLDAASVRTHYGFDGLNRPVVATDGLGRGWWTAFDALDRVTASTDPRGRARQYAHDPLGRRTATTKPSGATDAFVYDGLGNWTIYTNAEGRVYTMAYDALGRLVAATNALGHQVFANRYDPVGNLTNRTDGAGNTIAYSYDVLNRLVLQESGVGSPASSFVYDPVGNLLSASNAVAKNTFAFDAMDRLTTSVSRVTLSPVSSFEFPVSYTRDAGGLVTNLVYASGKAVTRAYDPDGRLASVSDWLGHTWTFAWDGAGKPTGGSSPCGNLSTNHYDVAGRLSSWSVGTLAGRTITRDLAGLKTREDITAGPHPVPSFVRYAENTFDAADRLVSAQVRYGSHTNTAVSETYLYDGNGALTNLVSGSNAVFAAAYDPLGQMSNLDLRESAQSAVYAYDPLGNRVVSGDRLWIPDHADPLKRPLLEADAATGAPIRYYLWGPGRLLGFIDAASGALTVAHCDEYGSVVALTDASGAVLHTAYYGPNGQDWGTTGTNPTPFAWLGGHGVQRVAVSDQLGPLYLTRYRLYSASLNRFLSSDPLGLAGGLNLYAYGEGDPLSYIDPLGLCGQSVWGAAASGFLEGLGGGLSILANTFTFGGTDALGWTDSASYEGSQYTVSRVTATVARETAITAATLGIGTAARGGSAAAQVAYKGILVTEAATGGYQIGTGAQQISEGNYEAGALNVVAGGLRVGGSIVSAGAIAPTTTPTTGQKVYRVYGGDSTAGGASWSSVDPSTVPNYRNAAGLPSGGASGANNTGRFVIEGTLTDPSKVARARSALPLDGNTGGIAEYIIPNWMNNGAVKVINVGGANPPF